MSPDEIQLKVDNIKCLVAQASSEKKIDFGGHKEYFTCSLLFKMVMSETRNIQKMLWRTYCCANFFGTILGEDKFTLAETS